MTEAPPDRPVDLAELTEGLLDDPTLDQLVADLEQAAEILAVVVRPGPGAPARAGTVGLGEAVGLLRSGAVSGIQVRYRFQGDEWWDTLMRRPDGVRLVRIRQP